MMPEAFRVFLITTASGGRPGQRSPFTGCTVREFNSRGGELFGSRPDRPRVSPGLLYSEY
jgi:hypothetical protein